MVRKPPDRTRKATNSPTGRHAKVGIGSVLLFILMVVIAAISTGVLLNATGLFDRTDTTSPQSTPGPTDTPLTVINASGITTDENATVSTIVLSVERGSPTQPTDLSKLSIEWFGPTGHTTLTYGGVKNTQQLTQPTREFAVAPVQDMDKSYPELNTSTDRMTIEINATVLTEGQGLPPGTTIAVKFVSPTGQSQYITVTVPETIDGETTVNLPRS